MSGNDAARPTRWERVRSFVIELWHVLLWPSSVFGLAVLVLGGFLAGIIFWGGFNTALELTNTETFCTSCHEMRDNVHRTESHQDERHQEGHDTGWH